jgi:hypothetical protein
MHSGLIQILIIFFLVPLWKKCTRIIKPSISRLAIEGYYRVIRYARPFGQNSQSPPPPIDPLYLPHLCSQVFVVYLNDVDYYWWSHLTALPKALMVLDLSNTGIMGSNSTGDKAVMSPLFSFMLSSVDTGLVTGRSPSKESYQFV